MGVFRRWLDRLTESDEARLATETMEWACSVPGTVLLADAPSRTRVKVAGIIKRITVLPIGGHESLEALISDGTDEAVVVFMGRRGIGGFSLGTKIVVEGVLGEQRGERRMINPRLEFTA
jgi:hypothetical protein